MHYERLALITAGSFVGAFANIFTSTSLHAQSLSPETYYAESLQAQELMKRNEYRQALPLLDRITRYYAGDSTTWTAMAIALNETGQGEEAVRAADKALELGWISQTYAYYEVAKIYARQGKKEDVLRTLDRAIDARFTPRTRIRDEPIFQAFANDARFRQISGQLPRREFSRDAGWQYDIDFLMSEARRLHASAKREAFSAEFERAGKDLHVAIPALTDSQIRVRLQQLLALLHDGHTGIDIDQNAQRLPLRLYFFKDGVFVIDAADGHKDLIGSRVLRIGSRSIEQLLAELPSYVPRDNAMGVLWRGPHTLVAMEFLRALGATQSDGAVELTLQHGASAAKVVSVTPVPATDAELTSLVPQANAESPVPLYLQKLSTPYWFERVSNETLYFQFNGVWEARQQSIKEFADSLQRELDTGRARNLIVDVRNNSGGDLGLYPPILRTLAAFRVASPEHQIFCIIGRNTFSAAQAFIGDIERFVEPVFVGEPSGSSPNFVGESTGWFELPYSRTRASISQRLHQHATLPDDGRKWIAPQIPVELTSNDYFSNRDPALDVVLAVIGAP
jgi:tetratricopeptide (TPR) repeat protein